MENQFNDHYLFVNRPLTCAFDAMEPYIDALTMELHHNRHLQAYTDNLNAALRNYPALWELSLDRLIRIADRLPKPLGTQIKHNAGGVYNHRFFFEGMSNPASPFPAGRLLKAIDNDFGSFGKFREEFKKEAMSVFGSGYAWLVSDKRGKLKIITTANQDTPLTRNLYPILNLDVWEHAYYLKHYNKRADYIEDWLHVINWKRAEGNYKNR
ncbi:MAG: superoxide dismutase [Clostridia bacterium]|nr:superoxide dismutase [Clostridia bacterium]